MKKTEKVRTNKETMEEIKALADELVVEINKQGSLIIEIPVRNIGNIKFDTVQRYLTLKDKKSKRRFLNTAHTRKFMQTLLVAEFCYNRLLKEGLHTSIRDMYYALIRTLPDSKINTLDSQEESNICAVDLEVALNFLREDLNLNADPNGMVVGRAAIEDMGDTINWAKMGSGGWSIPSNVEKIKFKKIDADYILVIEKAAAFQRLNEDGFWKKNNCIIITPKGQASRGTRRLIHRLAYEKDLPVYVCTDGDGYGWYIYSAISYGSMALAHTSDRLATPKAKFFGLTMTDIEKYKLQKHTIKAKEVDLKRTREIMAYPWFKASAWQKELKKALDTQRKVEIEALTSRGIQFLSKTYIPEKIKKEEFLP